MGIVPPSNHDARAGNYALVGASTAKANLSDWAGGMRRFAREEGRISRSEFKLLEALELFGIILPERGTALDLGAAPGGWTRILRQLGQYVTAVDPGSLDPRLDDEKSVRHRRITAQEFLREEPDRFDIIVNDMRMDAADSARLMVNFASRLYRHGMAIMTIKLPSGEDAIATRQRVNAALATLQSAYTIVGARQLFHNRSEITVALRPRT
jgi:23S rRNA (cytidine2498-2'-O)-methyltransferase